MQHLNLCDIDASTVSALLSPLSPRSQLSPLSPRTSRTAGRDNRSGPPLAGYGKFQSQGWGPERLAGETVTQQRQPQRQKQRPALPTLNTNPFRVHFEPHIEKQKIPTPTKPTPSPFASLNPMAYLQHFTSFEEPVRTGSDAHAHTTSSNGSASNRHGLHSRRRHSYHAVSLPIDVENINVSQLLDRFLASLNRRLDLLDTYFQRQSGPPAFTNTAHSDDADSGSSTSTSDDSSIFDSSISQAWSTLHQVRDSCAHVSDGVLDAGRRRAAVLIETLESRYQGALARKETMEAKVQESVTMLEGILADFESRAYRMRDQRLGSAYDLWGEGRRLSSIGFDMARKNIDEGIEAARRAKEALAAQISDAVKRAREHGLLRYEDLPEPWKGNPHITRGYRFNETPLEAIFSIIGVSNEMFNIWSHLLGLVLVFGLAFYAYPSSSTFSASTNSDIIVSAIFFVAAAKCMACSTLWHTMSSISCQKTMERFACVDYTGISLLVGSSIITTEYTAFYCEPVSRWLYMTCTAILGICGTIAPWHPTFNRPDLSWLRVAFYVSLSLTGFLPALQLFLTRGVASTIYFYAPITKSILVYFAGAVLYAAKIPECWWPGAFDFVGGSHNIWHVAVLGGILFHYMAMQEFFRMAFERVQEGGGCSVY